MMRRIRSWLVVCAAMLLTGCAVQPFDYTAYRDHQPTSILVLPPVNSSLELNAGYGLMARAVVPLAESGYYVYPVATVQEVFRSNGLEDAGEIQAIPPSRLRDIFGADAGLYLDVTKYGTSYAVLTSATVVEARARLVDLATGTELWSGQAAASSAESQQASGGLIAMLVVALIQQIADTLSDRSFEIAELTSNRLLWAGLPNGPLFGPRSPRFQEVPAGVATAR